jgi:hypothetical protein
METHAGTHRRVAVRRHRALGGIAGNELLTMSVAAILLVLLAAEFLTLLDLRDLLSVHMILGLVLIPPVLLKLGSTGYRMVRYYTGSPTYRQKGPPLLPLRLLAPVLVASTITIFVTGVWLLALGHQSDQVLFLHQASVIVFAVVFGIHLLAYGLRTLRTLRSAWRHERPRPAGAGMRSMLVASSLGAGLVLAVVLSSAISAWQGGGHGFH